MGCRGQSKQFVDPRVVEKERRLQQEKERRLEQEKALKKSKKDVQAALNAHRLGWTTNDGKEF